MGTATNQTPTSRRLFIAKLSHRTKEHHLMRIFEDQGITRAVVIRKPSGNLAFLTFATAEGAAVALLMARKSTFFCHNKRIKVSAVESWHARKLSRENSVPQVVVKSQPIVENSINNYFTGIPTLPRECVTRIAEFLPLRDRARMEQVSRLWQVATIDSYRKVTRLDSATWQGKLTMQGLIWAINRCGPSLTSLRLHNGDSAQEIHSRVVRIAGKKCKKLQSIDLLGVVVRPTVLREIADNIHGLRSFSLGLCQGATDYQLTRIFQSNPNLQRLALVNGCLTGKALRHLPPTLTHFTVMGCSKLKEHHIVYAIQRFTQLKSFEINQCNMPTYDNIIMALSANRQLGETMTSLKISACPWLLKNIDDEVTLQEVHVFEEALKLPEIYKNLLELQVSYCSWVTSAFIEKVGRYMQGLQFLDFTGCVNIRGEFSLEPLGNLRMCDTLLMSDLHGEVRASFLKNLTALTKLDCRDNLGITDEDIGHLLINVHGLEIVSLEGCYRITGIIADYAWLLTQIKCGSSRLHLFLGHTMARARKEYAPNEFLWIHYDMDGS